MTRKALTTLVLALGLAVAPAAFAMPMDNGRSETTASAYAPYGMTQAAYRALLLRGSALNQIYGNAVTHLSAAEFKAAYNAGGNRMEPQELAALVARGQALNAQYGGGLTYPYAHASSQPYHSVATLRPDANGPDGLVKSTQITSATVATVRPDANGPDGLDKSTQITSATVATVRPDANGPDGLVKSTQITSATVATVRPDENGPDGIVKSTQVPSLAVATVRPDENGPDGIVKNTQLPTVTAGGGDDFEWGSVAIGAGTFAFVGLLAIASFVLTRRRHHPSF